MVTLIRWIDRKFSFDFPVGVFPCILERLRGTPVRLEEMTRNLPVGLLNQATDGAWTIKQNIGHLADVQELWDMRLEQLLSRIGKLVAADMTNRRTQDADHNSRDIADLLARFRHVRMAFVERLGQLSDNDAARSALHPRLNQPMRIADLAFFAAEHDDQHAALIYQITKQKVGSGD